MITAPAVEVRELHVRYGNAPALRGINLAVARGELFLLLGPSGCGKSTLLRTIAGLAQPDSGSVLFDGEDVTGVAPHLRDTSLVFQNFALWPHMNVAANVAFGLRERRVSPREIATRVQAALAMVNLAQCSTRTVDQLSGGEQQRVALARALVVRPRCLLLDEPLSSLDAKLRASLRSEIRRLCKASQLTAVYVTHDQAEALAIADRVAVMDQGRVLQIDTPTNIYQRPASRTVAQFLGDTNLLKGKVMARSGREVRVSTGIGEWVSTGTQAVDWTAGSDAWISVRPECIRVSETKPEGTQPNVFVGELDADGTIYLGAIVEHRLRVGAEALRIHEFNPRTAAARSGKVFAAVAPHDVLVLPYDDHA